MWLGIGYTIPHYRDIFRDIFSNPYSFDFDQSLNRDSVLRTRPGVGYTNYRFTTYVTVSCWVTLGDDLFNYDTQSSTSYHIVDIAAGNYSTGYSLYVTKSSNGTFLRWSVGRNGASGNQAPNNGGTRNQINITSLQSNGDSKVYHIFASFNTVTNESKIYLKSKDDLGNIDVDLKTELTEVPGSGNILYSNSTNAFCVGNTNPTGLSEWNGKIDEVAVWTDAFGEPESSAIFNFPVNGDLLKWSDSLGHTPQFKVWYRMGENASFTKIDGVTYNILEEYSFSEIPLLTTDEDNLVVELEGHDPGQWVLKNVMNTSTDFDLISRNVLEEDRVNGLPQI